MINKEFSQRYDISINKLHEYEKRGWFQMDYHYDEQDIEKLSLILTLEGIGFSNDDIDNYLVNTKERLCQLLKYRENSLNSLHVSQNQLDCLEDLIRQYEMEGI